MSLYGSQGLPFQIALPYASDTADKNGNVIDLFGMGGVIVALHVHSVAAGTHTAKLQQGQQAGMGDAADLAGSAQTVAAGAVGKLLLFDLSRCTERYARIVLDKDGTNAVGASAVYIGYAPCLLPVAQHADVLTIERLVSPAEGVA